MPLVEIPEADEPIEVPADAIQIRDDEDLILESKDKRQSKIQSRISRAERDTRKDLKDDDEFFREAAQERGYEFNENGDLKGSTNDEELKQLRKEKAQLEKKAEKADELESRIQDARNTQLENQILRNADALKKGADDDLLRNAQDRMEYDEDAERFVLTKNGNPRYNEEGEPLGAGAFVEEMQDEKPYLFKDTEVTGGPGTKPEDGPGSSGMEDMSMEERASELNDTPSVI